MKIIITGGSGMVGSALRRLKPEAQCPNRDSFHSLTFNPKNKNIIHLAAKVGGLKANTDQIAQFYYDNCNINQKILNDAHVRGANKVL